MEIVTVAFSIKLRQPKDAIREKTEYAFVRIIYLDGTMLGGV